MIGEQLNLFPEMGAVCIDEIEARPQCSATRLGVYACDRTGEKYQCQHRARFIIHGKPLCLRHAEIVALSLLLDETKRGERP